MGVRKTPLDWLRKTGAQGDVIDGLRRFEDWPTLWNECPRGDWLLGIAERLGVDHVALVRAAIACARVADGGERAKRVLEVAELWTQARATESDVAKATRVLEESTATDPADEAAGRAALAVGLGVTDRGVLPAAPAAAAESIVVATIDCGFELAMRWAHDKCAAAVRGAVPWSAVEGCIARIEDEG